jgi:release factor glutamine methyltransferase
MRLFTLPGVFRPRPDSWMLARALRAERLARGARVVDVCTGSGLLAIAAAQGGADATAIDLSRRAVLCAALNARLNGVRVRALRGDLLAPVRDQRFDAIVSNPPYLPADDDGLPTRGAARAWEAGHDGRALLDRLCAQAPDRLAPGGVLLVVHSELAGTERTLGALAQRGLRAEVIVRHRGALGPLMRSRAAMLEARGVLAPGQREEEVVIVRAAAPSSTQDARRDRGGRGTDDGARNQRTRRRRTVTREAVERDARPEGAHASELPASTAPDAHRAKATSSSPLQGVRGACCLGGPSTPPKGERSRTPRS